MNTFFKSVIRPIIEPFRNLLIYCSQRLPFSSSISNQLPTRWAHSPFYVHLPNSRFMWCGGPRDSIGYILCFQGIGHLKNQNPEYKLLMDELCRAVNFLDVGANTGVFTVAGCALNKRLQVVAVEALPTQCSMLRKNLVLNGFENRVIVRQCALADCDGKVQFHEAEDCTMGSLNVNGYSNQPGRLITVSCTTLDGLLQETGFVPDLVKIDVEGFEDIVLNSGNYMLEVLRPRLVIEVNMGKDCELLKVIFERHMYAVENITPAGLVRYEEIFPSAEGQNWLCTPL
jgi:FkbM family methyltransferase